jgi:hypothetical protein
MHLFKLCNDNKGVPGGLLCPTLKMAKRDVLPTFQEIAAKNNLKFKLNKSDFSIYLPQTKSQIWIFHGEDDGQSIRGPNLGFMLINEFTLISEPTYLAAIARVRHPKAKFRQIAMSGTFEEFGGVYELITEDENCEVLYASTRENKYIPQSYIKLLESSYDEELQRQYIDGVPVKRLGKIAARSFRREKHVVDTVELLDNDEVWVSVDFNVEPMSATLWAHNRAMKPKLRAFDEIALFGGSDTPELSKVLQEKLMELGRPPSSVRIYPDPAGAARSTKGLNRSDIAILKENFSNIFYKWRIASVRDCMNAVNFLFESGEVIISKKCKNLIADLEQVKWKDSNFEFDKSNLKRSHWLDGMKDMIDFEYPTVKPKVSGNAYRR